MSGGKQPGGKPQGQGASANPSKATTRPNLKVAFGVPKKQK
jgi:hypothetical protein